MAHANRQDRHRIYATALRLNNGLDFFLFLPLANAFAALRSRPNRSSFLTW